MGSYADYHGIKLPLPSQVQSGVQYGWGGTELVGSFVGGGGGSYTSAANVRFGTDRGDGVIGTLRVPSISQVQNGVPVDAGVGLLTVPSVGGVRSGLVYGAPFAPLIGTFVAPGQSDVRSGVQYGASGTEFTGTLIVNGGSGSSPVETNGTIPAIIIGDDYKAASGRSFDWFTDVPVFSLVGSRCFFGGSAKHKGGFLVEGTIIEVTVAGTPKWKLQFELDSADTIPCKPGCYEWSVELRGPAPEQITKVLGTTELIEAYTR